MALPFLVPAALAAATIGGNLINSGIQRKGQREANQANERLAQQQNQWNIEQWNRQNQYNDPAQQMARLQGAGLNPRMIYGSGASSAVGNAGSIQGYDRAEAKNISEGYKGFADIANSAMTAVQTSNITAQTEVAKAEALLKAQETLNKGIQNENQTFDLGLKKDLREFNMDYQKAITSKTQAEAMSSAAKSHVDANTADTLIKRASTELDIALEKYKGAKLENEILKITRDLNRQGVSWHDNKLIRMLSQRGISIDGLMESSKKLFENSPLNAPYLNPKNW